MPMEYSAMSFGKGRGRIEAVHLKKPIKSGFAGMISSKMFIEKIALVVDRSENDERNYDFSCLAFSENGTVPRILLREDIFYDFKRGTAEARTILLHEIGHYHNGDHGDDSYDDRRIDTANTGSVLDMEAKADAFAVEYLGRDVVLRGLKELKTRVKTLLIDDATAETYKPTLDELDARICLIRDTLTVMGDE